MHSYAEIYDDQARAVRQAVENAERELGRTRQACQGRETSRRTLDEALQEAHRQHRALDSPLSAVKAEIADLEGRVRDLQRQLDAKRDALREVESQAEQLGQALKNRRTEIAAADNQLARDSKEVDRKEVALREAKERLVESRFRALQTCCTEAFEALRKGATEDTARERFERVKVAYEQARHTDPAIMNAHEERIELKRHLHSSQVTSVRELLLQRLKEIEGIIAARFPGYLEGPPPSEDDEIAETFFWYDPEDDLTSLLLPLPSSCWHTPPTVADDPRGQVFGRVLWAFVQPLGDPVPTIECERDLVILTLHGDHSTRIADAVFEVGMSAGRKATFIPAPLPTELREAFV